MTIDPTVLSEAASRINLAALAEAQLCEPVFGSILPAADATATATPSASATATEPATPGTSETATPSATPTATESAAPETATPTPAETETAAPTESASEDPAPEASASQLAAAIEAADPTTEELQACANARAEVLAANTNLQTIVQQLVNPQPTTAGGSAAAKASTKASSKPSGSSSSNSASAAQVASAEAALLKAEQALQVAADDLAAAELVAPISGTVGSVDLAVGSSASSGSITIIGAGTAVVTFELPLKTRDLVSVGTAVQVTPAGASAALDGEVTGISVLETSGTSGDSPTYVTTVAVADPDMLLASGAKAAVAIEVKSVTGVVTVPASAVTPTGTGTATVQVLASAGAETPETVTVQTGTVGAGRVEITEGLTAGQIVVLADRTLEIPANATRRRTTTTSSSGASTSGTSSSAAKPSAGSPAGSQPSASASR